MRLRRLPPLAWGAQQSRRNPPSRTWSIRYGRQDIGQYDLKALLSRQPASGWPFQQRHGVVTWQPARGWPTRQRTGHNERIYPRTFDPSSGRSWNVVTPAGLQVQLNRCCHKGRAIGRRALAPKGLTAPAVRRHNAATGGTMPRRAGRECRGGLNGADVGRPQALGGIHESGATKGHGG